MILSLVASIAMAQDFKHGVPITDIGMIKDGTPFMMARGDQYLCFPDAQNAAMKGLDEASSTNAYYFNLESPQPMGDKAVPEEISDKYIIRVLDGNRNYWALWGNSVNSYLNNAGWIMFTLTLNNQWGQDKLYGGAWDLQYVEGQGWTLYNVGYAGYVNDAGGTSAEPQYWTLYFADDLSSMINNAEAISGSRMNSGISSELLAAIDKAKNATAETESEAFLELKDAMAKAKLSINFYASLESLYNSMNNLDDSGKAKLAEDDACARFLEAWQNCELDETVSSQEYKDNTKEGLKAATLAQTTAGADFSVVIANPEINGADGWTTEKPLGGNGPLLNNSSFEYWAGNASDRSKASFDYYQVITGLPNGAYTVTADMYNSLNDEAGATWNATSGVYGKGANESVTLVNEEGATLKPYTTGQVFVVDGTIRIGVKNTVTPMAARWFVADNFKLTYLGETPEYAEATKPYDIAIAEGIENGTVAADLETAIAGATVTLTATPAEGYKLESISVMAGDTPVEVSEEGTFVMPAAAVIISAVFAAEAVEPEPTPVAETFTATLVHTASSTRGNSADIVNTVDAEKEHVNNTNFNNVWAASAYAEFSLADLPNGATITKATLSYTGIGSGKNRNTDVLYVNAGETIDYESMPTSGTAVGLGATLIETVSFPANATTPFTADVTDALKAILASQNYIIIKWTNNAGGGDIAGKASENAPQLVVEYMPGAPEIANASFEADGEKAASNSPLTLTGWTFDGVGSQWNNTEIRPAGSTSTTSNYGTSDPSDGEYSLFFRQGWNGTGNTITITSDALTAIPAGDYTLSVDYKQYYAYDDTANSNTKVGISIVQNGETLGSAISPAAEGIKGSKTTNTYFNTAEWSTLEAGFTLNEKIQAGAQIVITLYSAGQARSDFFIDNVQLVKVPGVELALIDLNKAIETAKAETGKYIVGDGLFQYPASQIEPLTSAIATAESAYAAAESKETVVAATDALNAALASFAPVATLPAADKQYTLSLKTTDEASPFDLSIAQAGITIAEVGTPVSFVAQEDGSFALSNGTEYVVYSGANTWTLAASADPYGWTIAAVEGGYTITGKNGFLGTNTKDGSAAGSTCYGDKKSSNGFYIWTISEYVAPAPTYAIAIAEGIENGTIAANVETAEEGATVTLTATPAEGYKLEAITVTAGEASVDVTEAEGTYTFVMPAAAVTVSATFVAEAIVPEPVIVYTDLAVEDYYTWSAADATGEKVNQCPTTLVLNESTGLPFGDGNVYYLNYVDLSDAVNMVVTATDGTPRMLFNRVEDNGTVNVELPLHAAEYWTEVDNGDGSKTYTVDVKKIVDNYGFAHLHCIKGANWANTTVTSVKIGREEKAPVEPTTYAIAIAEGIENGTIAADVETAAEGATVTLTATPAEGYKLEAITVTAGEASVEVTEAEGAYTFVMPAAAVTVSATFAAEAVEPTPELPAIAQEFTSIEEIAGQSFVIINKQTGKILFGTDAQNLGYDNSEAAIKETNSGYNFKLDTPAVDAEDETIANCYLLRLMTPAGEAYNIWGNPGYLNSQPATGNCSFILGLNNQNGQDIKNGAVWDIQYVEGKGFTLLNKGTGLYLNDNAPAKYDEPVYWTFCTLQAETEPELAKVENMTLTVAEGTVIKDDKTFPVVFGYTVTVDESIAAMASGWISYTVTAEGKEPITGGIDFNVAEDARNIWIPGLDNETDYTITINSVSVSYFDLETYETQVAFEKKFEAGELTASFNTGVPVGINGVAAGAKANRKVVENGRVVIYKNGVKTMSSGVSIR